MKIPTYYIKQSHTLLNEIGPYPLKNPPYPMKQSHTLHTIAIAFCDIPIKSVAGVIVHVLNDLLMTYNTPSGDIGHWVALPKFWQNQSKQFSQQHSEQKLEVTVENNVEEDI